MGRRPQEGDTRTIRKFLLAPKGINGEFRWLETAVIEQEARMSWVIAPETRAFQAIQWRDIKWGNA